MAALSVSPELEPREAERLRVLHRLQLLDSPPDPAFDRIVRLAKKAAGADVALLSFIDTERQWFKAKLGVDICSTPRDISFCTHAIQQDAVLWIEDASKDARFAESPFVAAGPCVRFYAGASILVQGQAVGTLCVLGMEPRSFDPVIEAMLQDLADVAAEQSTTHLQLRRMCEAEEYAEATRARYASLFASSSEPLAVAEPTSDGRFIYVDVNPAMERAAELPRDKLVGRTPREVFPKRGEMLETSYRSCLSTGSPVGHMLRLQRSDQTRTFDSRVSPVRGSDQRITGVLISARDVTDSIEAETAARISHERFARLFDHSADALFELGVRPGNEFVIVGVNDACEQATGLLAEQVIGRSLREALPEGGSDELLAACRDCVAGGVPLERETVMLQAGGLRHWMLTLSPLRDRSDAVVRLLVSVKDVSERRLVEARRRESQKLEAIGQLAGGLAHDFNNLLQVIDGYTRRALPAAPAELGEVLKATERGTRLVRQLLVFSRRQVSELEPIAVPKALADAADFARALLGAQFEVSVDIEEDAAELCVETDVNEFCQAMLNLASNARDAMAGGGTLVIALARTRLDQDGNHGLPPGDYASVSVIDSGCGMAPEIVSRIFDPFYTTKDQGKGTGLGLAMVYGYVQQSRGAVEVFSAPGEGSTFRLLLPLTTKQPVTALEDLEDDFFGQGETVLLVEDDPAVRALACDTLNSLDYLVIAAGSGEEGLAMAAEWGEGIDLVVSDIIMPGMGGLQMVQRLRAERPDMPAVFISGHPVRGDLQTFELPSAALFLHKPFKPVDLARMLRRALTRSAAAEQAELECA